MKFSLFPASALVCIALASSPDASAAPVANGRGGAIGGAPAGTVPFGGGVARLNADHRLVEDGAFVSKDGSPYAQ